MANVFWFMSVKILEFLKRFREKRFQEKFSEKKKSVPSNSQFFLKKASPGRSTQKKKMRDLHATFKKIFALTKNVSIR
jgi:hypothetical protein